ncbi:MBL fold metallo-hydrolase [Pontiella agarivorans]|uniref:MBL fold metallo-hydrolase n=1 Tax=Pontiella agarivorans TaxID=3038953 RepID=A0ABU5MXQ0_9BACT|nr:MBL fold metallo-hydrolase [Pontiella agarivorans]MDZ8118957.1 MBL fold metallo-hydrolase [Pontiella agarivorans]
MNIANDWFKTKKLSADTTLIFEPHAHVLVRANMFLVEGSERDMIFDTGMGVIPLKPFLDTLRRDPSKEIICVASHTHIDHIGAVHEFDARLVHPIEAEEMAKPTDQLTLFRNEMPDNILQLLLDAGYPPIGETLLEAPPYAGYDPATYRLQGAAPTGLLNPGNTVDLGNHLYRVLHLPGHSPGSIGLFETSTGVLFAGDAIYDGPLIFEGPGTSIPDYRKMFELLKSLPIVTIHGGHDSSFDRTRMLEIIRHYEAIWDRGN